MDSWTHLKNANNLWGANLRDADIPIVPNLHQSILAALEAGGELDMRKWHTCETTHCRAGWAIHLAGKPGAKLEAIVGPAIAGMLITMRSCPWIDKVPNFYGSEDAALADIQRCAALEAALEEEEK